MTESEFCSSAQTSPVASWNVVLIAARETCSTLMSALRSVLAAAADRKTVVDVIVNGRRELVEEMVPLVEGMFLPPSISVRLWFVPLADKAHAWNVFVHELYVPDTTAFFIDGYALPNADAFERIQRTFDSHKDVVAVSGVPTAGHGARKLAAALVASQGLHGNLHGVAAEAMSGLRSHGVRLPLGLYRVDGLTGAVLRYRCDPALHDWSSGKIVVDSSVSWAIGRDEMRWTFKRIAALFKRRLRQAQGELENLAMRHHLTVRRRPAGEMPLTASQFVHQWMAEQPEAAKELLRTRFLVRRAARSLARSRNWSKAVQPHQLFLERTGNL